MMMLIIKVVKNKKNSKIQVQKEEEDQPVAEIKTKRKKSTPISLSPIMKPKEKQSHKKIQAQTKSLENKVRDITGMTLQYPNPFTKRLEEKEPKLFVKAKNDKIDF